MPKEPYDPPDRLQITRIHYICPVCLADIYRDSRQQTVKCAACQKIWCPDTFREGSLANGIQEDNPRPERYDFYRCTKHKMPRCKQCEKEELYSE